MAKQLSTPDLGPISYFSVLGNENKRGGLLCQILNQLARPTKGVQTIYAKCTISAPAVPWHDCQAGKMYQWDFTANQSFCARGTLMLCESSSQKSLFPAFRQKDQRTAEPRIRDTWPCTPGQQCPLLMPDKIDVLGEVGLT